MKIGLDIGTSRRWKFRDTAFLYRMPTGFEGDVNRTHPVSIEPAMMDVTNPPATYGRACVYTSTNTIRGMLAGDTALTKIAGVLVRPFPVQQRSGGDSAAFGAGVPQAGAQDVLKAGYIMVRVVGAPKKGDPVNVWIAADSGAHVQGGFEASATGGSTIALAVDGRIYFNGPPGADGIGELAFNV